jgi:RNA polymerase sigma-70 factor (ECF subfamily)
MDGEIAQARMATVEPDEGVPAASAGARSGFVLLYEECRLPVYRFLRSRSRSDDEAADLTASAFERALRSFSSYDTRQPALPWVLRIARNAAIDAARRRRPVSSLGDRSSSDAATDWDSPEAQYLHAERDAELRDLVFALPDVTRDAVALRFGSGLSAREIGGVIGKSESATQKLIQRALVALREAHDAKG